MPHRRAVLAMVLVTLLWSLAGVVTRHLSAARFEITFWRSLFNACALALFLSLSTGPRAVLRTLRDGGRELWLSGLAWGTMFTAFMLALTWTTVANVLVTMAIEPLIAAFLARVVLGDRVPRRTFVASLVAGLGITWMYSSELQRSDGGHVLGTLVALAVPIAAACNWMLIQRAARNARRAPPDMRASVLVGAMLSALVTLPLALPSTASVHDLSLLAFLGVFQLAVPCLLVVAVARVLPAPELALLSLLEVLFGVAWAWLGAGERPPGTALAGGALVLAALVGNELLETMTEPSIDTAGGPPRSP